MIEQVVDENQLIGIFHPDVIAYQRNHVICPMCDGLGNVVMAHWKNPKACAVCKGVGQINENLIPHPLVMVEMTMRVFPPRVAPSRPVPEGQ